MHDGNRPQPKAVVAEVVVAKPPSDATVLFDGTDLSKWNNKQWKVEDGVMTVGDGNQATVEQYGDIQLHVEWAVPEHLEGVGGHRGNSGIFLMGLYEVQIIDGFKNKTYPDGMAGGLYGQHPPLVNACAEPGQCHAHGSRGPLVLQAHGSPVRYRNIWIRDLNNED